MTAGRSVMGCASCKVGGREWIAHAVLDHLRLLGEPKHDAQVVRVRKMAEHLVDPAPGTSPIGAAMLIVGASALWCTKPFADDCSCTAFAAFALTIIDVLQSAEAMGGDPIVALCCAAADLPGTDDEPFGELNNRLLKGGEHGPN